MKLILSLSILSITAFASVPKATLDLLCTGGGGISGVITNTTTVHGQITYAEKETKFGLHHLGISYRSVYQVVDKNGEILEWSLLYDQLIRVKQAIANHQSQEFPHEPFNVSFMHGDKTKKQDQFELFFNLPKLNEIPQGLFVSKATMLSTVFTPKIDGGVISGYNALNCKMSRLN